MTRELLGVAAKFGQTHRLHAEAEYNFAAPGAEARSISPRVAEG